MLKRVREWPPVAWVLASEVRRVVAAVVVALILFLVTFFLLGRAAKFHEVASAAREADKLWLPLCLVGELLAYAGYVISYRDVARADGGPILGLKTIVQVVVIGFGATFLGASVGGLAMDYWALRQAGASGSEARRRVLALNTLEWGVLALAACIAAALVLAGVGHGAPLSMTLSWLVVVPLCVAAAIWTTQPHRVERLTRVPERRGDGTVTRVRQALRAGFGDAIGGTALVRHLVSHPARYHQALGGFGIYWFGDVLTLYAGLRAFDAHVDIPSLVLAYSTGYIATAIPLPGGGAGGIDASVALSLTAVGVPFASAVLGVLVYRGVSFWLPVLPAVALLPSAKNLREEIDHSIRAERDSDSERPLPSEAAS
jgi:uncharacterized membrane protein YbhN (UPF0104 family)